ncbi:hypothetical protein PQD74_gp021 [Stenotrophomonas phage Siara]|uniref:Uncharacterized protein n=1 Tax=Stenotrophomonas phage Siara TaxID=2859658 RepID=A0AAE7WMM5_9CAUD|nr:hypothetical protein PQD74_gp021 [Stenotrophomonas phage Siara]QYW02024.1 hypothetical protein CPT_Siara_021 [Stenotrophomonas phage Siara]
MIRILYVSHGHRHIACAVEDIIGMLGGANVDQVRSTTGEVVSKGGIHFRIIRPDRPSQMEDAVRGQYFDLLVIDPSLLERIRRYENTFDMVEWQKALSMVRTRIMPTTVTKEHLNG